MNIALTRDKFIFGANPVKVKQTAAIQFSAHDKHEREQHEWNRNKYILFEKENSYMAEIPASNLKCIKD